MGVVGDVSEPQIPACQGLARQVRGALWLAMANLIKQVHQLGHHVWMLLRHRFEPSFILIANIALWGGGGGRKGGRSKRPGKTSSVTTKPNKWIEIIIPNKEGVCTQIAEAPKASSSCPKPAAPLITNREQAINEVTDVVQQT